MMISSDFDTTQKALIKLMEIKDSDIRILTLEQGRDAVDKGVHIGGAFSAVVPLVALYYGGIMRYDVEQPTREGQDLFVLSKGHAVAAMASVYADLGYFDPSVLVNSRSEQSILNGHPGPVLPGVHISTGPLGQGVSVAQGFAIAGKEDPAFDVYCLAGDGELQEGTVWEAIMFAGQMRLDNLCLIVDKNEGQLDCTDRLHFSMRDLPRQIEAFGWNVVNVDATRYGPVTEALAAFSRGRREGRPTAVICNTRKGYGGFSSFLQGHKVTLPDSLAEQEIALQRNRRQRRVEELFSLVETAAEVEAGTGYPAKKQLVEAAEHMGLRIDFHERTAEPGVMQVRTRRAGRKEKRIAYDEARLPVLDPAKQYAASDIVAEAMKEFAKDRRIVSIDADLSSTSGLEAGVGFVDRNRALNVGIAEANMMNIGEAFAALGYNVWASTFCPFFDWKVLRRIAVGQQERLEIMAQPDGWLSEGHGLDLTFLATAPNLETKTNGATHMGNDDAHFFSQIAGLKIIDISCPQQLLAFMRWIMEGNRGLVYVRIMRSPSAVLYGQDQTFAYGKGYVVRRQEDSRAVLISSGRGVHEALSASRLLEKDGVPVDVIDMPSVDREMLLDLYDSGMPLLFAEQNNGYLWSEFRKILVRGRKRIDAGRLLALNTSTEADEPQFIHSAMYEEMLNRFNLSAERLAARIRQELG